MTKCSKVLLQEVIVMDGSAQKVALCVDDRIHHLLYRWTVSLNIEQMKVDCEFTEGKKLFQRSQTLEEKYNLEIISKKKKKYCNYNIIS